ncbi:MAG: hypothetical protein CMM32_04315 [Rhodospirillaceae bacterium]|nr:hypothetical protein [Rhodospirillaceae bacterium]|tara:strand:+ start:428 stop:799 length:372 start_codon:yes stop_codon:yes gene_type:complete
MRATLTIFFLIFLPTAAMGANLNGKGVLCSNISQGFFFEYPKTVRIYRIYGMEVWDWEQSSYNEVGKHRIEWHYDGDLYHLDELTLILNGMNVSCEFVNSKLDLKKGLSPMSFFENLEQDLGN